MSLLPHGALSKESLSLLHKAFLWSLVTYASPGWFPFLSVTNIIKLERFHWAASRAIFSCLSSSLRLLYLLYKSLCLILLCHLMSGLFVSQPLFSHFRFGQTWSKTKTLQIVLESFSVHSPAYAFIYFS